MGNFATLVEAENRAISKVNDGTWVEAHACLDSLGRPAVRFRRREDIASPHVVNNEDSQTQGGSWDVNISDAVT